MTKDKIKCGDWVFVAKSEGIIPSCAIDLFRRQSSLVTNIRDGIAYLFIIDQYGLNHYAKAPIENLINVEATSSDEDKYARYRDGKWNIIPKIDFLGEMERKKAERNCKKLLTQEDSLKEFKPDEHRIGTPFHDLLANERWEAYRRDIAGRIAVKLANLEKSSPGDVGRYSVEVATMVVRQLREMPI